LTFPFVPSTHPYSGESFTHHFQLSIDRSILLDLFDVDTEAPTHTAIRLVLPNKVQQHTPVCHQDNAPSGSLAQNHSSALAQRRLYGSPGQA
jgi:hypothetical protein